MGIMIDTPEGIAAYRMLALRGALKLEIAGLRRRGPSAATMIKKEFNLKGNNIVLLEKYEALLRDKGILR